MVEPRTLSRVNSKIYLIRQRRGMEVNITKLSSRGQVVIPREIRESLGLQEGVGLLVFRIGDSIILKATADTSTEGLVASLETIRKKIRELRITRRDVQAEIKAVRESRQKTRP